MRYFVLTDIHGHYTPMINALREKGYTDDDHVILLGDAFDGGKENAEVYSFILKKHSERKLIYVKGNHEDYLLSGIRNNNFGKRQHTDKTAIQIAEYLSGKSMTDKDDTYISSILKENGVVDFLKNNTLDYFETDKYVFVHGFIPFSRDRRYFDGWRTVKNWFYSRLTDGMKYVTKYGVRVPDKTIVCGHVGTFLYHESRDDHSPFYAEGVIGLDAHTKVTGLVNCIVIEDLQNASPTAGHRSENDRVF